MNQNWKLSINLTFLILSYYDVISRDSTIIYIKAFIVIIVLVRGISLPYNKYSDASYCQSTSQYSLYLYIESDLSLFPLYYLSKIY
jgi:hypothetical protein